MNRQPRHRVTGFSLIELLVSMAIGGVLIAGAVLVYSQSRTTYATNDAAARLQEQARYAFAIIEPDLQLAGYYGFTNAPEYFFFDDAGEFTQMSALKQIDDPLYPALGALPASAGICGKNFAVDLMTTIEGSNNEFGLPAACRSADVGYHPLTDTLTIRRSEIEPAAGVTADRIQLLVHRFNTANQRIFNASLPPEPLDPDLNEVRNLVVRTYYIGEDANGFPELRVISLRDGPGGAPTFEDTLVIRGVEDMQVQFGMDTGDYDADNVLDSGQDPDGDGIPNAPNGAATRYIDATRATDPDFAGFQIASVRIWLRVRAEQPEQGHADTRRYEYAGTVFEPGGDNIRRVLISRTISLRNGRIM